MTRWAKFELTAEAIWSERGSVFMAGVEPATDEFSVRCSTSELLQISTMQPIRGDRFGNSLQVHLP